MAFYFPVGFPNDCWGGLEWGRTPTRLAWGWRGPRRGGSSETPPNGGPTMAGVPPRGHRALPPPHRRRGINR